jgi:CO/xanthine dehydrogenase Mo-binding subunit
VGYSVTHVFGAEGSAGRVRRELPVSRIRKESTTTTQVFGTSVKRREDPRLVTGNGNFVDDIKLVGLLHMVLVRSPHAHANVKSIDTSGAKAVDGVVAVFTGEELKDQLGSLPVGWPVPDTKEVPHPPLAFGTVRYVGDAVAAVVASDAAVASDATELVEVEYEELPAVLNMEEAIYDDSGQLLTGSMMDYAVPTAEGFPMYETDRTVTPTSVNPMGVKGAGETATIAASPAVINAVVDALSPFGIRHIDMPAKPEKVWRAIRDTRG